MKERMRTANWYILITIIAIMFIFTTNNSEAYAKTQISAKSKIVLKGKTVKLSVEGTRKKVKWSSSNTKIAKVWSSGKVKGVKSGKATIYAQVGNKKYKCKVTVENPEISVSDYWMAEGEKLTLKVNGTSQKICWESSNPEVAMVENGKVVAKETGKVTIYATVSGKKFKCKIQVFDKEMKQVFEQMREVHRLVNKERSKRGIAPLKMNYTLCEVALIRCKETTISFTHDRPNGKSPFSLYLEKGLIKYSARGENIAMDYYDAKDVVSAWMSSLGHRQNILDERFKEIGIGYLFIEDTESIYWVQNFYAE